MILSVRPLGALHLSLRQIPSPSLRASYYQETLLAPLPSTILGALGAAMGIRLTGQNTVDDGLAELYQGLCDAFGGDFTLWGPLVRLSNSNEYYIVVEKGLCPSSQMEKYVDFMHRKYQGFKDGEDKPKLEESWSMDKIGVRINPMTKTTVEGHLYMIRPASASSKSFIEYLYELEGVEIEPRKTVIRLGGESRLALLELRKGNVSSDTEKRKQHVVLSPCIAPLSDEGSVILSNLAAKGGATVERVYGKPELLGIGFSEVLKRRRPLMAQISPGSVITFTAPENSKSWIGNLTRYGFGSVMGIR